MSVTDTGTGTELLEDLLVNPPREQPAHRVRLLRQRLQHGLRATELLAGGIGGLVLALLVRADDVSAIALVVGFALGWRLLGTMAGVCVDEDERPWRSLLPKVKTTAILALTASWVAYGALALAGHPNEAGAALLGAVAAGGASLAGRGVVHALVFRAPELRQRVVIVGSGMVAQQVIDRLRLMPHTTFEVIGLLDDDVHPETPSYIPRLGGLDHLERVIRERDVDRVIVAFSRSGHDELLRCIRVCWENRVAVDIVPRLFEFLGGAPSVDQIGGLPLLSITVPRLSAGARVVKRATDIVLSLLALIVLAPLLLLCALLIKLDSPGPVFFRQARIGHKNQTFYIFKFRSMYVDAEERKREYERLNDASDGVMFKIRQDPRVTRVGRFLRRFSIDELPQLINVLRGDMSLVGPRPLIPRETAAFSEQWHRRRLDLRPGMSGPWQVSGRSDLPFADMLRLDYEYVARWSLARDLEIIFATIPVVISGRGAY